MCAGFGAGMSAASGWVREVDPVHDTDVDWGRYRHKAREKPLLSAEVERTMLLRAQQGDQRAVRGLVDSHMRLVVQVASRYAREGLSAHDLVSEGVLGLMEAVRRFDLSHDARFASYAAWWVRACVRRYALANRRIVGGPSTRGARVARARMRQTERLLAQRLGRRPTRAELAEHLGVTEQDVELVEVALSSRDVSLTSDEQGGSIDVADDNAASPEQAVAEAEHQAECEHSVRRALAALNDRERAVVREQFFEEDGKSLADVGRKLGVSRQRAGQILACARDKLRARLEAVA
jgi:RNA polymerase sigma-32 factor